MTVSAINEYKFLWYLFVYSISNIKAQVLLAIINLNAQVVCKTALVFRVVIEWAVVALVGDKNAQYELHVRLDVKRLEQERI